MLKGIVIIISLLYFPQHSLCGSTLNVSPATLVIESGTPAIFVCVDDSRELQWQEILPNGNVVIFDEDMKNATASKYDNFEASLAYDSDIGSYRYFLNISNTAVEDEGQYLCQYQSINLEEASGILRVEVKPTLTLTSTGLMIEGVPHDVVCEAVGSRPQVTITWFLDNVEQTTGIQNSNPVSSDPVLSNTRSVFTFTPNASVDGSVLTCETSEHTLTIMGRSILDQNRTTTINVAYPPAADVIQDVIFDNTTDPQSLGITCLVTTQPNPAIQTYSFTANDSAAPFESTSSPQVQLRPVPKSCTNFTCRVDNGAGTASSVEMYCPYTSGAGHGYPCPTTFFLMLTLIASHLFFKL